ncbi:histidine kinase [Spirosoma foliorum]|uniref:histidine kinase n=2 Tax=Spirosoma foliorum TaxID=2710596 RepID=A0A7G5H6Y2_9BACT|nr:histidine kinase [Spirosoma foliorum]
MNAYYLLAFKSQLLETKGKKQEAKLAQQQVNKFIVANPDHQETALLYTGVSNFYYAKKDVPLAFEANAKANLLLERLGEQHLRILILERLASVYFYRLDIPNKALDFYLKETALAEAIHDQKNLAWIYHKVAFTLIRLKRFEEAAHYAGKAKKIIDSSPESLSKKKDVAQHYDALGQILMGNHKYREAISNFKQALQIDSSFTTIAIYFNMYIAQCYQKMGNLNESISYGLVSYEDAVANPNSDGNYVIPRVCRLLFENYDSLGNTSQAYNYLKIEYGYRKAIEEQNATNRLAEMEIQSIVQKSEQARLLKEKENQNQRWWLFSIAVALFSAIVLAAVFYRNNLHKQKANTLLYRQKEEIDCQRDKAENALTELKTTQQQLIQKEKLASLGELTAGIAHEIQNPLNFVNNFSEVSAELIEEQKEALAKGDTEEAKAIAEDLSSNLQKINHHGGRASSIVKGMLEHSRTESGEKRPTNLNALADEYLKLAYHGLKAKEKSFTCELVTEFDPALGLVKLTPQEIGRVLLNLYNNAFYAVDERKKQFDPDYKPTVKVRTKWGSDQVEIRVSDNGIGIPDSVKAKIFQPFFTTKPTGEGTGLGLSLSYDIITKGHGGMLIMDSQQNQGTEFTISLPTKA